MTTDKRPKSATINAKDIKRVDINIFHDRVSSIEAFVKFGTATTPAVVFRIEEGDLTDMIRKAGKLKVTKTPRQKYARLTV